jgi:hypothetical protein
VLEQAEHAVFTWLAITELVCAGIEALGGFYGNGQHRGEKPFCKFVYAFMHSGFGKVAAGSDGKPRTYCQHLQDYFRHGLDHGFSIEWGGIWFSDHPDLEVICDPH